MALQIVEFFGLTPLDSSANANVDHRKCPFIKAACIKPNHGACTVRQIADDNIICCPNRLYADGYRVLADVADSVFGAGSILVNGGEARTLAKAGKLTGKEVAVFGRNWGQELPLPRPKSKGSAKDSNYFVDWILARLDMVGDLVEFTALEVQTIDTTGSYRGQADRFFKGLTFTDSKNRTPGFSSKSGMNWENVNKRILPQLIYKGHVLRREAKCSKGLVFVCPKQVLQRVRERLGDNMLQYHPGPGAITFMAYELGPPKGQGQYRDLALSSAFTTTVDQVALAFTSPMNLPAMNVYETAINAALKK